MTIGHSPKGQDKTVYLGWIRPVHRDMTRLCSFIPAVDADN